MHYPVVGGVAGLDYAQVGQGKEEVEYFSGALFFALMFHRLGLNDLLPIQ